MVATTSPGVTDTQMAAFRALVAAQRSWYAAIAEVNAAIGAGQPQAEIDRLDTICIERREDWEAARRACYGAFGVQSWGGGQAHMRARDKLWIIGDRWAKP